MSPRTGGGWSLKSKHVTTDRGGGVVLGQAYKKIGASGGGWEEYIDKYPPKKKVLSVDSGQQITNKHKALNATINFLQTCHKGSEAHTKAHLAIFR